MDLKDDVLFCRFTAWLKVVVKRAKIDYIRHLKRHSNEVSIEDEEFTDKLLYEPHNLNENEIGGFSFENQALAMAMNKLSVKRRRVLELLFIHNFTPDEAASELQCSVQHIYNMRSLALNDLRNILEKDGN